MSGAAGGAQSSASSLDRTPGAALKAERERAYASMRMSSIDKVERNGVIEGIKVKIFLCNNEERSLFFPNVDVSARQVCLEMARKEMLKPESVPLFSLWIIGNDLELQLKPDHDLFEIVEKFPRYVEKYTHESTLVRWRFVYKREAMIAKDIDRKVKDPHAIHLLFVEAVNNVLTSRYPLPAENDAVILAGIQMQVKFGNYSSDIHRPGFLLNSGGEEKLREFIPKHYFSTSFLDMIAGRVPRPAEWEERILAEHRKLSGKPSMIAQLLYLQYVRQSPFYGSTFFSACLDPPPRGYFEYRTETYYIGVNAEGIHIVDADKVRLHKSFLYDDINWDCTKDTFTVESGDEDNPTLTTLITPQASLVSSIVSKAIKLLNKKDQRVEALRREQAEHPGHRAS